MHPCARAPNFKIRSISLQLATSSWTFATFASVFKVVFLRLYVALLGVAAARTLARGAAGSSKVGRAAGLGFVALANLYRCSFAKSSFGSSSFSALAPGGSHPAPAAAPGGPRAVLAVQRHPARSPRSCASGIINTGRESFFPARSSGRPSNEAVGA